MGLNLRHLDLLSKLPKVKHTLGKSAQLALVIPDDLAEGIFKCRVSSIAIYLVLKINTESLKQEDSNRNFPLRHVASEVGAHLSDPCEHCFTRKSSDCD